jgi:hypothetical protein
MFIFHIQNKISYFFVAEKMINECGAVDGRGKRNTQIKHTPLSLCP